jgi:DNA-binding MarR family transcriptional regulator
MSSVPVPTRIKGAKAARSASADARTCAAQMIAVVPGLMHAIRASMRRHIDEGLSVPQFRCLGFISRHAGASVSEVAGFLGVTLATASTMVDRLARSGYVLVATSSRDRRRSELNLNAPGKALLARLDSEARRDLAGVLASRSEEEIETALRGLAILHEAFGHGA